MSYWYLVAHASILPCMGRPRNAFDFYPTPDWATRVLLQHVPIHGRVIEPCAGDGAIARVLTDACCDVVTNDIDKTRACDFHNDATGPYAWDRFGSADWIVTNPPFSLASQIVLRAYDHSTRGIAMLLRLSWLEPCADRARFHFENPISDLIVLPRISFTGDGKTDSVTCAWMVWDKQVRASESKQRIRVIPPIARVEQTVPEAA